MVHSAAQMREELDEIHVDIGVLFPDHFLKLAVISQVDYASALAPRLQRLAPRRVVLAGERPARLHPRLPAKPRGRGQRDTEVCRRARHGRGVPALCRARASLGTQAVDPIYDAAQSAVLPVLMHSVTVICPVFPFNTQGFETEFGRRYICSHTFSIMANMVHMITTGVPVGIPTSASPSPRRAFPGCLS